MKNILIRPNGVPLYVRSTPGTTAEYVDHPFEPYTTTLFADAVRPGATVLDIGSQFGYYALLAAERAKVVYAFEPVPANYALLERNVALNARDNVVAVQKAVGNARSTLRMFVYKHSDSHSMYAHPDARIGSTIDVECVTLDEFFPDLVPDVIKIDIEGHEPYALAGMQRTLARNPDLILFLELAPAYLRRAGVEPRDYLAELGRLGFVPQLIDEHARKLVPLRPEISSGADRDPTWYANLYCTKG